MSKNAASSQDLIQRIDDLTERLLLSDGEERLDLCTQVARAFRQDVMPKEGLQNLRRWADHYYRPAPNAYRYEVWSQPELEELFLAPGEIVLLALTAPKRRRTEYDTHAADWIRNVIINRDTSKLKALERYLKALRADFHLRAGMTIDDLPVNADFDLQTRFPFAAIVFRKFREFWQSHQRLPCKSELLDAVNAGRGNSPVQTSQWTRTLGSLGLAGLPRLRSK